jgi:hypothetical protein
LGDEAEDVLRFGFTQRGVEAGTIALRNVLELCLCGIS